MNTETTRKVIGSPCYELEIEDGICKKYSYSILNFCETLIMYVRGSGGADKEYAELIYRTLKDRIEKWDIEKTLDEHFSLDAYDEQVLALMLSATTAYEFYSVDMVV